MDVVTRGVVAFLLVFLITRIVGRRELGTLEPFDLILLVVLGDLIQQGVTQSDYSVTGMTLAVGTITMMTVLVSYLSFRFRRLRPLLDGEPSVMIQNGKVLDRNLKRERLTEEELARRPACSRSTPSKSRVGNPREGRPDQLYQEGVGHLLGRAGRLSARLTVPVSHPRPRRKVSRGFDEVFRSEGIQVIRTPVQTPNANAHAERWVGTLRGDCLDQSSSSAAATSTTCSASTNATTASTGHIARYSSSRPTAASRHRCARPIALRRRDLLGGLIRESEAA